MPTGAWLPLLLFMALLLAGALQLLAASGHFPAEHRGAGLRTPSGGAILFGTSILVLLALAAGTVATWKLVSWYAAVIGGGLAILMAPLALQPFPDSFVNGRASLIAFAGVAVALAAVLFGMSGKS